jgi:hypothetical protein
MGQLLPGAWQSKRADVIDVVSIAVDYIPARPRVQLLISARSRAAVLLRLSRARPHPEPDDNDKVRGPKMKLNNPAEREASSPEAISLDPWERKVGAHTLRFEPPDILFLRPSGAMSGIEASEILDAFTQFAERRPCAFGLMDVSELGSITAETRRIVIKWKRPRSSDMAVYGASFRHRVTLQLLSKAAQLLGHDRPPTNFLETEREARAYLEERRRALASERR